MQIKLNVDFQVTLGAIKKWCLQGRGGGEYPKLVTKSDIGGSWVHSNSDITTKKKNMYKFKKDLMLLMNSCIFLVFKYTLGRRLGTGFIDL